MASADIITLNNEEINIIKTTWEIPRAQPASSGEAILYRLFQKYPHNQNIFDAFRNTPLESLKTTTRFKSHAGRIIKVFDNAIEILETGEYDVDKFDHVWDRIANFHHTMKIPKSSFLELQDVAMEVISGACNLDDTQKMAWESFFNLIYHILFSKMDKLSEAEN